MKVRNVIACAVAVLALAACNKQKAASSAVKNDNVTITQATPPPGGNWSDVVNATSAGFMMGNPNAKVKLVEIGALTCPHCREFEEKGVPDAGRQICEVGSGQLGVPHLFAPRASTSRPR